MKPERVVQAEMLRLCGALPNVRLFRNMVGVGIVGRGKHTTKVRFGLMPGSADLIGWRSVVITPAMVGQTIAQFLSIEVKSDTGRPSPAQLNWQRQVEAMGGLAIVSNDTISVRDYLTVREDAYGSD